MAHLTLTGVSEDGARLLLVDDTGAEHTLEVDARLRAALRGPAPRPGQEKNMDSTLRPRDIQARIRAGESAEAVAEAAGTSVEKIMPFAAPVLAERAHVAERAQRSSVRRRAGESAGSARTLGDAVAAHLRPLDADPGAVDWDAWRRGDGRWTLVARYDAAGRSGAAHFTYDVPGSYVIVDDDDARWLVGDAPVVREQPAASDDLQQARQRRLGAVPGPAHPDDDPLGEDAIELVRADEPEQARAEAAPPTRPRTRVDSVDMPLEAFLDEEPAADDESALVEAAADAAAEEPDPPAAQDAPEPEPEQPTRRPVRKSRGRASVPSWDEIMFGGGKPD